MTPGSNAQSPQSSFPTAQQTVFAIHPSHVQPAYSNPPHMAHVPQVTRHWGDWWGAEWSWGGSSPMLGILLRRVILWGADLGKSRLPLVLRLLGMPWKHSIQTELCPSGHNFRTQAVLVCFRPTCSQAWLLRTRLPMLQ